MLKKIFMNKSRNLDKSTKLTGWDKRTLKALWKGKYSIIGKKIYRHTKSRITAFAFEETRAFKALVEAEYIEIKSGLLVVNPKLYKDEIMTQKEKAVISYLSNGKKLKSQIVNRFQSWYKVDMNKKISKDLKDMVRDKIILLQDGYYFLKKDDRVEVETKSIYSNLHLF